MSVVLEYRGAPTGVVTNDGEAPIREVHLAEINIEGHPDLRIEPRAAVHANKATWPIIPPGEKRSFVFDFVDAEGKRFEPIGQTWDATVAFTDSSGQRWRRVNPGDAERAAG